MKNATHWPPVKASSPTHCRDTRHRLLLAANSQLDSAHCLDRDRPRLGPQSGPLASSTGAGKLASLRVRFRPHFQPRQLLLLARNQRNLVHGRHLDLPRAGAVHWTRSERAQHKLRTPLGCAIQQPRPFREGSFARACRRRKWAPTSAARPKTVSGGELAVGSASCAGPHSLQLHVAARC